MILDQHVFPNPISSNTATVGSNFSLLAHEQIDARKCLVDLSLDGIIHCKQWMELKESFSALVGQSLH